MNHVHRDFALSWENVLLVFSEDIENNVLCNELVDSALINVNSAILKLTLHFSSKRLNNRI